MIDVDSDQPPLRIEVEDDALHHLTTVHAGAVHRIDGQRSRHTTPEPPPSVSLLSDAHMAAYAAASSYAPSALHILGLMDPFQHHLDAQAPVYETVLAELRAGRKRSHWIWFIFPQLASLGRSYRGQRFGLRSRAEAEWYLAHPVLGARLRTCTELLLTLPATPIALIPRAVPPHTFRNRTDGENSQIGTFGCSQERSCTG